MANAKIDDNWNPTLTAVSTADGETPVRLEADPVTGNLQVDSVGTATSANQTNGTQKTQIVDAGGEVATVTGGKLDVNATASLAGTALPISGATDAVGVAIVDSSGNQISSFGGGTQYTDGDVPATATGPTLMFDNGANWVHVATGAPLPVTINSNVAVNASDGNPINSNGANALLVDGSGVTQPVSGTVTADTELTTDDLDTGAGTDIRAVVGLVGAKSGGGVLIPGDATAGLKVDLGADNDVTVTNATAANLKAEVVGTGTFAVQVTSAPSTVVTATSLDVRPLVNTDVVTAELSAVDNAVLDTIAAKDFATQTTLAAINAKLVTGTDIGDVTINNGSGAGAVNIQDGGNTITVDGTVSANATLAAETTKVIGTVNIAASQTVGLAAGSALVGKVGIDQTTSGTTNAVVTIPATSGGLSIVTGSVGATPTAIKAAAGQLYGYHLFNTTAAVAYVQIFNVAHGSVTLGTTAPTLSIGIPASGGVTVNFDKGIAFDTAISFGCTTTRTGSTGATCDVNFFYK